MSYNYLQHILSIVLLSSLLPCCQSTLNMNASKQCDITAFKDENCTAVNLPTLDLVQQVETEARRELTPLAETCRGTSVANASEHKTEIRESNAPKLAVQSSRECLVQQESEEKKIADVDPKNCQALLESNRALKTENEQLSAHIVILDEKNKRYKEKLKSLEKVHQAEREVWAEDQSVLEARIAALEKHVLELSTNQLQALTEESSQEEANRIAFGQVEWKSYFGDVDEVPLLPSDIDDILNANCPFWPQYKVRDTHFLVLIPSKVNDRSFTLNMLDTLAECPHRDDCGTKFHHYELIIADLLGELSPKNSYWALITSHIIPHYNYSIAEDEEVILSEYLVDSGYVVPSTLEMTTSILAHYLRTGEFTYPDLSPDGRCVYTRCHDQTLEDNIAIVGGLSSSGISLRDLERNIDSPSFNIGVALSRRL